MLRRHFIARPVVVLVVLSALFTATATIAEQLTALAGKVGQSSLRAPPESAGLAPDRLARITNYFRKEVTDKKLSGAVALIASEGRARVFRRFRDAQSGQLRSHAIHGIFRSGAH